MNPPTEHRSPRGALGAGGVLGVALLWVVWGLARHPGFQPVTALRLAAPILALLLGVAFTQAVARLRARIDGARDFDRGGKALFMGFVMVTATLLGWLLVSHAIPSTFTAWLGTARTEAGVVSHRVPETADADCRFRLVVASASMSSGAVPRPLDECVAEAVWAQSTEGGAVMLRLLGSALGAELVDVEAAGGPHG